MGTQGDLSALEKLEQEFEKQKSSNHAKKRKSNRHKKGHMSESLPKIKNRVVNYKKYLFAMGGVLLLVFVIMLSTNVLKKGSSGRIENIPDFLTAEEKKDWKNKEVDKEQIYIYINTDFTLQSGKEDVQLRLVNPPYCAYPLNVVIINTKQTDKPLYESEIIYPGDSIENVDFKNIPKNPGTYDLKIQYTFYDEKGESVVGEHEVGAKLEIKE